MSEQPEQTRPNPPDHDPLELLDFPAHCAMWHMGIRCTRPAAYTGTVHSCTDKRNGTPIPFCQDFLTRVTAQDDYPYQCACGHHMTSLINYVWDFEPINPNGKGLTP